MKTGAKIRTPPTTHPTPPPSPAQPLSSFRAYCVSHMLSCEHTKSIFDREMKKKDELMLVTPSSRKRNQSGSTLATEVCKPLSEDQQSSKGNQLTS